MNCFSLMMRSRSGFGPNSLFMKATARGGHFARPDPKPYKLYDYSRRTHLEDINTVLYSDFAPEFHMHLHSIQIQHSQQGVFLLLAYFTVIIMPMWLIGRWLHKKAGAMMFPSIRPGPDHAHMCPRLFAHLRANNQEAMPDPFGRRNATFYMNFCRQEKFSPDFVRRMNKHGFTF